MPGTESLQGEDGPPSGPSEGDCLVVAMHAARPLDLPLRARLEDVDEVQIGRGDADRFVRSGGTLRLELASSSVSTAHARLARAAEGWSVVDEGSKNGTWVNGERARTRRLGPRDLVEVGQSFLLLRPGATDVSDWSERPPSLRSLSAKLERSIAVLERVAASTLPLLLLGETGTGKEVAARAVHRLSRRTGSFTAVNCGGLPETLFASELFGARKGAYSGAHADRPGLMRQANGGTLFLDEIGEVPPPAQAVLLRALQEREVLPLGSTTPVPVDARVIAATNEDLVEAVGLKRFRRDLYARLSGVVVELPPLRDRPEDVGLLVAELLPKVSGGRTVAFHRSAARALFGYDWPLNVRELEHALAAAIAVCPGDEIQLEHLPAALTQPADDPRRRASFLGVAAEHEGNVSAIARHLGTSRSQVRRLAARYGLDLEKRR